MPDKRRSKAKRKSRPKAEAPPVPEAPRADLTVVPGSPFKRDLERMKARGKDLNKIAAVIDALKAHRPLAAKHVDHGLTGNLEGYRDCHVEPDWVLIYKRTADQLLLFRTGTHSDLDL